MEYILGKNLADAKSRCVILSEAERLQHLYSIGGTGTGKSALFYNLMRSDLERGRGFVFLDPHGVNAKSVADAVPAHRITQTIYFDPLSDNPLSYDPLIQVSPKMRKVVASQLAQAFKNYFGELWGLGRMQYVFTNGIRILLDNPETTLVDLSQALNDANYRAHLLRNCSDEYVYRFWTHTFAKVYTAKIRSEAISAIDNKLGQLVDDPILRAILGVKGTIRPTEVIEKQQILLVNLSENMGIDAAHLLGSLLVTGFTQAAMARDIEADLTDFGFYADEFQHFANPSFAQILSEARKCHFSLALTHQYTGQVPKDLLEAVLGNVGTVVVFRVGPLDAPLLCKYFDVPEQELIKLSNYNAYTRIISEGSPITYRIETLPPDIKTGALDRVLRNAKRRHARERPTDSYDS